MKRAEAGGALRTSRRAMLAAVVLAVAATPAAARDAASDGGSLKSRVEARLTRAGIDQRGEIEVVEHDGGVVLEGAVVTVDARRQAEKLARKETKAVENSLRVVPPALSDDSVRHAVAQAILEYPRYGVFDSVELAVSDGAVVLSGSVLQPYRKTDIESRVARVEGVREIRNEIRVQPVSTFDDRLRGELYRAIYGDQRFAPYRNWSDPPVRIVVENGRVTLTGYVGSRVEQALLEHIARSSSAFGVVNRVQIEGEAPKEAGRQDS